jgi:predicted phage terminase large subunit-like protein
MGRFEANNGGDFYADDISAELKKQGYSINISKKKAPTNMSKLSRIEQHAPNIREFYFLDDAHRTDEYRRFMNEVTGFSFTTKNVHDDAPDSLGQLVEFLMNGVKSVSVAKRPF